MNRFAFTLAEVLITIAVIGIVAAMTIPSIITKYQKRMTVSRLQKGIAILEQSIKFAEAEHGESTTWVLPNRWHADNTKVYAEKYFFPYIKTINTSVPASEDCWQEVKTISGTQIANNFTKNNFWAASACATLVNGEQVYLWANNPTDPPHVQLWIDINGKKEPNMLGKDVFGVFFKFSDSNIRVKGFGSTREDLISADTDEGCNKSNQSIHAGESCAGLIAIDGWEIKDDYPW